MNAVAKIGRNPASKHQIKPEHGDEQTHAGRDYRTHRDSRETKFLDANGDRGGHFPCSADHEQDWQPYTVDPYSCYYM